MVRCAAATSSECGYWEYSLEKSRKKQREKREKTKAIGEIKICPGTIVEEKQQPFQSIATSVIRNGFRMKADAPIVPTGHTYATMLPNPTFEEDNLVA